MRRVMLPLSDIIILDFSRLLPGPWASQVLVDSGAKVIKVEQPEEGDHSRGNPPFFDQESVYFHSINRGKKSLCLNLKSDEGRAIAEKLISKSDVLIENFRVGVAEKLGVGYEQAKRLKKDLIYCSITGFGRGNPYQKVGAHDLNIQGLMGSLGPPLEHGKRPEEPSFLAADYASASFACIAILLALIYREKTKQGCFLDLGMYDSLFAMQNMLLAPDLAKLAHFSGEPALEVWGANPRYAIYRTKDKKAVTVSLLEKKAWERFCKEIGRDDLFDPEERAEDRHSAHGKKGEAYRKAIEDFCGAHERDEILRRLHPLGVAVFPVYSTEEAIVSPLAKAREMIRFSHDLPYIASPLSSSHLTGPGEEKAPGLGEHNEEILRDLGFSKEEIEALTRRDVLFRKQ